jgi:sec-independent protein translocase protein TatA
MSVAVFQGIGVTELLIVLGIVLLIFGPKRLPMLGRQLGRGLREFKDSVTKRHDGDDELPEGEATEVTGEVVPERERPV